jgi:transposase
MLAAAAGLGRAGRLAAHLARVSQRVERARATGLERTVSGRQFRCGENGDAAVGKPSGARARSGWWWSTAGCPLGDHLHSASPAEVRLAETTLAAIRVGRGHRAGRPRQKPVRGIADQACDSDPLRNRLRRRGIELICPHKRKRVRPATQDARALRRYRQRWIVERTIGWLGNFWRLLVRYDRSLAIYRAFFHIVCFMIVLQ